MISNKIVLWITPNTSGIFGIKVVTRNHTIQRSRTKKQNQNLILIVHIYLRAA